MDDAAELVRESWWAEMHPVPEVCEARRLVLEARDALHAAGRALDRAVAELRLVEARHAEASALVALPPVGSLQ